MSNFQYKDFPVIPEWLKTHIFNLIELSLLPDISIHGNNSKDEFVKSDEKWISADQEILDIISKVEYNKNNTLG